MAQPDQRSTPASGIAVDGDRRGAAVPVRFRWPALLSPDVAHPSAVWLIGSRFVVPAIGLFAKFWMTVMNRSVVYNAHILHETLDRNYQFGGGDGRPLITYCNHTSCMDDPLIWGSLMPLSWLINSHRQRWTTAAAEICFKSSFYSVFFAMGKTFPIIRGEGIYQPPMEYAARLLKHGLWVHFFPEGKVIPRIENADPSLLKFSYEPAAAATESDPQTRSVGHLQSNEYSLKWGLARLIIEHVLSEGESQDAEYAHRYKPKDPEVAVTIEDLPPANADLHTIPEVDILPMYHIGMDDVLPTRKPYVPRMFHRVTFLVRPEGPIRIDRPFLMKLFSETPSSSSIELTLAEKRRRLMRFLEEELDKLAEKAKRLHFNGIQHEHHRRK